MPAQLRGDQLFVDRLGDLRSWLKDNHARTAGVWLVTWKKHAGVRHIPWSDVVDELLCFGWVDSTPRKLDADRSQLRIAPRNPKSAWSGINKSKVERLLRSGRMTEAGQRLVDAAKANGAWDFLNDVETLTIPDDLAAALGRHAGATQNFEGFPPSVRRGVLEWIKQAKRADTRARRIAETAEKAARGERANAFRRR